MNPIANDTAKTTDENPGFFSKALKIMAYPVSIFTAAFVAISGTRDESYNKLEKVGTFEDILEKRKNEVSAVIDSSAVAAKEIPGKIKMLDSKFAKLIEDRIKDRGYGSMMTRFDGLHINQKMEIVLKAVGVGGVVLGALITISDSKLFKRTFDRASNADADKSAAR